MIELLIVFCIVILDVVILGTFAWGAVCGAPWVPSRRRDLARILACADVQPGMRVADLGCGSGGVLAVFARAGCAVEGWELAVLPWIVARVRFLRTPSACVHYGDFWHASLRGFDRIYVFLMPATLERLAPKLMRELTPGAVVISYAFPIPGWMAEVEDRAVRRVPIYRYRDVLGTAAYGSGSVWKTRSALSVRSSLPYASRVPVVSVMK